MSYGTPYQSPPSQDGAYHDPPPAYTQAGPSAAAHEPLIGREWENDVPDDFKYGVTIDQCDSKVRSAFVGKVYSILFVQIATSTVIAGFMMFNDSVREWVVNNIWFAWVCIISTFVTLLGLLWKRRSYPTNFILLGVFTLVESYAVGVTVLSYEVKFVLQALILTSFIFVGLSLFTLQSKFDFSGMGPFLMGSLLAIIGVMFLQLFFPFGTVGELLLAIATAVIFCGFIIFDTYNIMKRLSPEEYVIGAVELYLDFINLFLAILRILNASHRE